MDIAPRNSTNTSLGYAADDRLLIINADDFGMCHAVNDGILRALEQGVVTSTSLMAPCPWAAHAMRLLRERPHIPFGVHLTVVCHTDEYRWGPVEARERVPSLIDRTGFFYPPERIPELLEQARLEEMEAEFRAQIESVLATGLRPTHLDWHCLATGGRADVFDMTCRLGGEYGLAVRTGDDSWSQRLRDEGLPVADHGLLDSFSLDTVDKAPRYEQMLRELPAGLSEWAVHPGLGDAELQAIEPDGWQVRQTDLEFLVSDQAREVIRQEVIAVLSYEPLQRVWQDR